MSLINQALKKEQQRRSLNLKSPSVDIPTYESEPLTAARLSRSGRSKNTLPILLGFTALGAVLLVCGGAFVYFGKTYLSNLNPGPVAAATDSETAKTHSLASSHGSNSISAALAGNLQSVETIDAITAESALAAQGTTLPEPSEDAAATLDLPEAPNAVPAETATLESVTEKPKFNIEVQNYIDGLQVHG